MKNNLLIFSALLLFNFSPANSQKKSSKNFQKIKTLKVNFISSELNLTPEVAEKFWPIYNAYETENRILRTNKVRNIRIKVEQYGEIDSLSDEMAMELSYRFVQILNDFAENKKNTFKKLEAILTPKQLLKLNFAEIEFNKRVYKRLNQRN